MENHQRDITSARESEPIAPTRGEGSDGSGHRRSGWRREELRVESNPTQKRRRRLPRSTALLLLVFSGFAFWSFNQLSTRTAAMTRQQAQIKSLTNQLFAATTELEETRLRLDTLVNGRVPGLLPFRVGEPIAVDTPFVREISFKPATPPASGHQIKIVVENDSNGRIRPRISALFFDDVGSQVARVRLVDGRRDPLRAGEIRSFSANLHTADGIVPRHFRITSD